MRRSLVYLLMYRVADFVIGITEKGAYNRKMQYLERLRMYLRSKIQDDNIIDYIMENFEERTYKKGECILGKGEMTSYIYFTLDGMARSVYVREDGKERTMNFYGENTWSCLYNFFKNKASNVYVEALQDTVMACISVKDFRRIIIENKTCTVVFMQIYSKIEHSIRCFIDDFDSFTLQKKYDIFLEEYNDIEERIDDNYIASYLGITQEEFLEFMQQQ